MTAVERLKVPSIVSRKSKRMLRDRAQLPWLFATLGLCSACRAERKEVRVIPDASDDAAAHVSTIDAAATDAIAIDAAKEAWLDTLKNTVVVHIGDSFTHAHFQQNLRPRFRALGVKYHVSAKTPSYTTSWSVDPELTRLLNLRPKLVIVSLGANEMDHKTPPAHAFAIKTIAKKIAAVSAACVWVSPPSWKKERSEFLDVIRDNCAPCIYFDSDARVSGIERTSDGIHPSERGGAKWATAFWEWLLARGDPTGEAWGLRDVDDSREVVRDR